MDQFYQFTLLPTELQTLIWEAAIPPRLPTAYHADLTVQRRYRTEHGTIGRANNSKYCSHIRYVEAHKEGQRNKSQTGGGRQKSSTFITTLSSLLLCCQGSSAVALAIYNNTKPIERMTLDGLRHEIDASCDLVIFQHGWQQPYRTLPDSVRYWEPRKTLRHIALQWPGPGLGSTNTDNYRYFYNFNSLANLICLWADLKALYVVVNPEDLQAAQQVPWLPEEDRHWDYLPSTSINTSLFLAAFLERYRRDEANYKAKGFQCGSRQYYEVGADQLVNAGGLEEVAQFLFMAQEYLGSSDEYEAEGGTAGYNEALRSGTKCMILSWRQV